MTNSFQAIVLAVLVLILIGLAAPSTWAKKSWWRFLVAMGLSFVGVVLPLLFFGFSTFLVPEWKGACIHGWLDCFIIGKMALTPLVLWATGAWYALEILRVKNRTSRWIVIGIFLGAIVATVCFIFGLACLGFEAWVLMLVPFYVAAWYSIRAVQLIWIAGFSFRTYFFALLGSLPFWLASLISARFEYAWLPDKAPQGCFIVTAAGRGHAKVVGPLFEIEHGARRRLANQQLITFWQLENNWQNCAPRSHRNFRRLYNRIGPVIAAQIKSPWLADLTFMALKPVEVAARLINHNARRK